MTTSRGTFEYFQRLLAAARRGERKALGELLHAVREPLLQTARLYLDSHVRVKCDASDVVQETLCEAGQRFEQFRGEAPPELLAWLKKALVNNLHDCNRRFAGQGRAIARELSLDADSALRKRLLAHSSSPSARLEKKERHELLDEAIGRLPAQAQAVLILRHRGKLGFDEIAQRLQITENAARKAWVRAVEKLQQELARHDV